MDKTMVGLLGAVGALVAGAHSQAAMPAAAAQNVLQAASYADLLRPIPNALETLAALDAPGSQGPEARVEEAQYFPVPVPVPFYRHHHHHHHHRYYRQRYHHHHHHHHHHNAYYR